MLHELQQCCKVGLVELRIGLLILFRSCCLQILLKISVIRIHLQSLIVSDDSLINFIEIEERSSFTLIPSWPRGIHLDACLGILQCFIIVATVEV